MLNIKNLEKMDKKKVSLFLLFAFGISWISAGTMYLLGVEYGSTISAFSTAILFMCAPAIAAIIVQKFFYKQAIKDMGLKLREAKGWKFFWIPAMYILLCVLFLGTIALFGNGFQIYGFGEISFKSEDILTNINAAMSATGAPAMSKLPIHPIVLLITQIISSFLAGVIINTIPTLGEELGWRGFLFNETKQMGFWKSNLFIGIIWGIWHAPVILQGHNYPDHPVLGVFMMILFCIPLGYIMSYLRIKTNSVLAPALFHAALNAIGGNLMMYTKNIDNLIGGVAGLAGVIAGLAILLLIVVFDGKTLKKQVN